jgi:hypothetical protein
MFEAGRVFLPADAPWLSDYIDELCAFPHGVHDDQVDATTQALNYLRQGPCTEPPPMTVLRQELVPGLTALLAHGDAPSTYGLNITPSVGRKVTDGRGLLDMTTDEIDQVLFGNLEGRE